MFDVDEDVIINAVIVISLIVLFLIALYSWRKKKS